MCVSSTPAEPDTPATPLGRPGGYHRGGGSGGFNTSGDVPGSDYTFGIGPGGLVSTVLGLVPGVGPVLKGVAKIGGLAFDHLTDQKNVAEIGVKTGSAYASPRGGSSRVGPGGSAMAGAFSGGPGELDGGDAGESTLGGIVEANASPVLPETPPLGGTSGQPVPSFKSIPSSSLSGRRGPSSRRGSVLGNPNVGRATLLGGY